MHADAQRRGIARRLYGVLLDAMRLQGLTQAVGVITLPGAASVAMHEAMGFTPAGVAPVRLEAGAMVDVAKAGRNSCRAPRRLHRR
ncbi:hypothetical protein RLIN73S_06583 [Rhodanobacter lindaniclasticus]